MSASRSERGRRIDASRINHAGKRQALPNYLGVAAKVRRGADQANSLKAEMDSFCTNVRRSIIHEIREDTEEHVWVFRGETPIVPIDWSVRLGEIFYDLRSALDHLVWQLVLSNEQVPGRHTAFPVVRNEEDWEGRARRELSGVGQAHVNTIRRLQPIYGGPGLPFNVFGLWRLHSLCNIDKHRHLILAIVGVYGFRDRHNQARFVRRSSGRPVQGRGRLGRLKRGGVVLRLNDAGLEPGFQIDVRFEESGDSEISVGTVPNILDECLGAVRGAVGLLTPGGLFGSAH